MCTHTHTPPQGAESHLFPRAQIFSTTKSQPFDNYSPKPRKRLDTEKPQKTSQLELHTSQSFNFTVICYYGKTVVNGWKDIKQQYRITKLFLHDLKGPILCFSNSAIAITVIRYLVETMATMLSAQNLKWTEPSASHAGFVVKKIKLHKCKHVVLKPKKSFLPIWQWIQRKYAKRCMMENYYNNDNWQNILTDWKSLPIYIKHILSLKSKVNW